MQTSASVSVNSAEADLISRAAAGDMRAFEGIVCAHSGRVLNFLTQMTRHRQDAEDLTQQTFIKVYHNLHRFDPCRPFTAWLFTIARRTALNHFRDTKTWSELPEQ